MHDDEIIISQPFSSTCHSRGTLNPPIKLNKPSHLPSSNYILHPFKSLQMPERRIFCQKSSFWFQNAPLHHGRVERVKRGAFSLRLAGTTQLSGQNYLNSDIGPFFRVALFSSSSTQLNDSDRSDNPGNFSHSITTDPNLKNHPWMVKV